MTPEFRRATRADLPAIVALLAADTIPPGREIVSDPVDPAYVTAFETIDADPDQLQAVGVLDGRVVATMQLTFLPGLAFRGGWRGQIEAVRVAAELRGQGIGARLIDWAVERCRARDCFMVQLTSHRDRADAHRFYERLGWTRSHASFKLAL
jgi:GNAT superfamily N-acetyltransferase